MQAAPGMLLEQHATTPETSWPREPLELDERWQLTRRVVASRHFARSPLLSKFLLFVVTETLEGRQAEITEHQIGVQVFGRPSSYRTVEDNIVRNYARQLRKRLAEHFAEESCRERMQIEIPVGGYVPAFPVRPQDEHESENPVSHPEAESTAAFSRRVAGSIARGRQRPTWVSAAILLAYSALLVGLTWGMLTWIRNGHRPSEPAHALWRAMLAGPENTYIVPPDAGFNLIEDISKQSVPLADYMHAGYRELPLPPLDNHSVTDLRSQQLTDFVDVEIVARILRRPEYNPDRVFLRFPRDLRLDDLKTANAVLVGSVCSNPWAAVKDVRANFAIVCGNGMQDSSIVNREPRTGEAAAYASHWNEPTHVTYALVSFLPNLGGNGHLLLLEGLDVAGTQAAAEALLQSDALAPVLRQATRPDGSVAPFEVLLRSTSIQANATDTQVIASRIH